MVLTLTLETFDPTEYLEKTFNSPEERPVSRLALENLHKFFSTKQFNQHPGETPWVLDYGCGPVVANIISAVGLMDLDVQCVLAEFTEISRKAIQQWLDDEPAAAWDWSPYFKYVIHTLEGKDEKDALKREKLLRQAIKGVVPCDITQDPLIAKEFKGPYDIVMSILCIENGCLTQDDYRAAIWKVVGLIKNGGTLLLYSTVRNKEGQGYYHIGKKKYIQVALPVRFIESTLEEAGFVDITRNVFTDKESIITYNAESSDLETTVFITASKSNYD